MIEFCGDDVCAARVQLFLLGGQDPGSIPPCPQCIDALADSLRAEQEAADDLARVMRSVHNVISGRL